MPTSRLKPRISSKIAADDAVSRLPVGSSASTSGGECISARAIATRCCMPPDSSDGRLPLAAARPTASSSWSARARAFAPMRPSRISALIATFSVASKAGSRWWNWNTNPSVPSLAAVSASSDSVSIRRPCSRYSPAVGRSSRPIRLSSVLLPEPDGPIMAANSPGASARSMPCSTSVSIGVPMPYDLRMPRSSTIGAGAAVTAGSPAPGRAGPPGARARPRRARRRPWRPATRRRTSRARW